MVTIIDEKKLIPKRTPKKKLTDKFVQSCTKPGRYSDGYGLHLWVKSSGAKYWIQRLVIQGKSRDFSLGSCRYLVLGRARVLAYENFCIARLGGNPIAERQNKRVPTFKEAALEYYETIKPKFKSEKYHRVWLRALELHTYKYIGNMPITEIEPHDIRRVLNPIWEKKHCLAKRVKQKLSCIFLWAIALQYRKDSPTLAIEMTLSQVKHKTTHRISLPYCELPSFLEALNKTSTNHLTKLALEFLILTATRKSEVLKACWSEIDLVNHVWEIPAERTKMGRAHRIPLSAPAMLILEKAKALKTTSGIIFHGRQGKAMAASTFSKLLKRVDMDIHSHGFRTTFRTWVQEKTNCENDVAELALAHVNKNIVERAYARSDLFEKRALLMDAWADYVTGKNTRDRNLQTFRKGD